MIIIVLERPNRSPSTPKNTPPIAQPIMKMAVAQAACLPTSPAVAPLPSNSAMAGRRARLNNCCAIVSNIQPMLATLRTNQWYPVNSRYQAYFGSALADDSVLDMNLQFYYALANWNITGCARRR